MEASEDGHGLFHQHLSPSTDSSCKHTVIVWSPCSVWNSVYSKNSKHFRPEWQQSSKRPVWFWGWTEWGWRWGWRGEKELCRKCSGGWSKMTSNGSSRRAGSLEDHLQHHLQSTRQFLWVLNLFPSSRTDRDHKWCKEWSPPTASWLVKGQRFQENVDNNHFCLEMSASWNKTELDKLTK